jgi:hypothetical protein
MNEAVSDVPPDLTTVMWKQALGRAGPYEKAINDGSLAYDLLLRSIERAGGSFDSNGYHVWVFPDGLTIGRRSKTL